MKKYDHKKIEQKWQKKWEKDKLYEAKEDSAKKKYYPLVEFPYPSGDGLHVGHIRPYVALDIVARKRRAEGYNVLYPFGWDAFGLPTENYAIKTGIHPAIVTKQNTDNFRRQVKSIGLSFDWSREINTTDPEYYKWTQWIFLQLFKKGLAYKTCMPINWCIDCKIGLANEEVLDEVCERCGGGVETREKEQWMLAITKYADRLYDDLDTVDYLEKIKVQQRNWIGRSEGAIIRFKIYDLRFKNKDEHFVEIFTTRPDTLFGATYMVLSPEHSFVTKQIQNSKSEILNKSEIQKYVNTAKHKTDAERVAERDEKTGVEIKGIKAINPANNEEIPVFVADYVLTNVGTGAIMAVPAHDERDFEFAKKYDMSIVQVIEPGFTQSVEPGKVKDGLTFDHRDAIIAVVKHWSEEKYLVLKWKQVAWGTFITGGIEEGQTAEEAAKMEIKEETGYLHPKLVKDFGILHGRFYHVPKAVNRHAHAQTLLFKLEDGAQEDIDPEELEKHDILWLTPEELEIFLTPDSHRYALKLIREEITAYTGEGFLTNSGKFNGLSSEEARKKITEFIGGTPKTTYKLRDWIFSRQRYWGEPIPIIHCEKCGAVPVSEEELPVKLPDVEKYQPTDSGESPLAVIPEWVNTTCPKCGETAKRETDTMPNWAGSSWYYLAYIMQGISPTLDGPISNYKKAFKEWLPADWYSGGMEHTTLHLLYSRFWHKFLFDIGVVPTPEPYQKRTSHGLILAEGGAKMSKSKGNVVSPDEVVENVGADTLRVYEMFMGPFEQAIAWSTDNMVGSRRFLEKVWKLGDGDLKLGAGNENGKLEILLHKTIKKVGNDIEKMKFNTAISTLMILVNELEKEKYIPRPLYSTFLILLSPFAPHITEELWHNIGNKNSIHTELWPNYDEKLTADEVYTIAIQVNGKVRATFDVDSKMNEKDVKEKALELPNIQKWTENKKIKKTIYVEKKLVNIVI